METARKAANQSAFTRLVRWIEDAGGNVSALSLHHDASLGRKVRAAAPISPNEIILHIPHRCLLTRESAISSAIGKHIAAAGLVPPTSHTWLAAYLLQEFHSPTSFFRPYLDLLPHSYAHIPLLFDDRDLALLRGSFTLDRIREKRETLAREYGYLIRAIPALRAMSYEQFVWARLTVITRIFGVTIAGQKTHALVPLADLFDHKLPRETSWTYQDTTNGFVLTALQAFSPGDEVHDSYGPKCNGRFFLNYGFVLEDNDDNEAHLRFVTREQDRIFAVPARYEWPETQQMFSFLRNACADKNAFSTPEPTNARNEAAALRLLAEACTRALGEFETTIEEDDALLANLATTGHTRSCVLMRRGEKRVLRAFLELTRVAIPLLEMPREKTQRSAEARLKGEGPFDAYLRRVVLVLPR